MGTCGRDNRARDWCVIALGFLALLTFGGSAFGLIIRVPDDLPTIQQAINACVHGDKVIVADGIYTGSMNKNLDFGGKLITVRSENGPDNCIIDCSDYGRGFHFHSGETAEAVVQGLTIRNGDPGDDGGGVYCEYNSSPTIINCRIADCHARDNGGGVYCYHSSPTLSECTISDNHIGNSGGGAGIYCGYGSDPTLIDCTITGNTISLEGGGAGVMCVHASPTLINCEISDNGDESANAGRGGGVYCGGDSQPILIDCLITDNTAYYNSHGGDGYGGGLYCSSGASATLIGCVIADNTADSMFCGGDGGGVYCSHLFSSLTLANCTITGNTATIGGAVYCLESSATLTNCILWGDTPPEIATDDSDLIVTYCDVEGGWSGEGDIDADPLFVDTDNGDYHLGDGSPCIDAGSNTAVPPESTTDLDGNPPIVDMGAYEFQACPADFDHDDDVDAADLLHLLGAWGTAGGDTDYDGDTDTADLLELLGNWGPCEPLGACCIWDGTCENRTANDCALQGPSLWFEGENCDTFQCPDWPTGACCVDSDCVATNTEYECSVLGGRWTEGETCENWYCPDEYCDGWGSCGQYISRVMMGEIDNSSGCDTGYADDTDLSAEVVPGYVAQIIVNTADYQPDDVCGIWVDWDEDFIFDHPRDFVTSGDLSPGFWITQIGAPPDAEPGPKRMRLRLLNGAPLDLCDGPEPGEVEDYTIVVVE
ncbi:MAG: right-handed parallel beta-helix repeat-containing protein [Planctomycetota bacterium]|nr:right-handed parallel beta-helix repeat-containing protein [Planctomycetota bacterium]